jgi:hypothetical protein
MPEYQISYKSQPFSLSNQFPSQKTTRYISK